jgi:hypothetical protein
MLSGTSPSPLLLSAEVDQFGEIGLCGETDCGRGDVTMQLDGGGTAGLVWFGWLEGTWLGSQRSASNANGI